MEENTENILDSYDHPVSIKRRTLLPWWIKTFCWIFMIGGGLVVISFIMGIFGLAADLSLYGLKTNQPISLTGFILLALFLFKGIAAYGLWYEKDWAILICQIDAITGIGTCLLLSFVSPTISGKEGLYISYNFSFKLELILLIPYLIKIGKIKNAWNQQIKAA
jgi:hypothetical protein